MPVSELNSLELEFLVLNGFNLSVPISELQRYGDQLLKVGYMEQEILKSLMYETPSYNPIRHGRSTSLGSVVRHPVTTADNNQVDQLCELASRVSLDERQYSSSLSNLSSYNTYPQQAPVQHHLPKMSSNGSLNVVRRMGSFGNLHHSPQVFNAPMTNHDSLHSPIDLDDARASYSPRHHRHSFNMWRHSSSSSSSSSPPPPQLQQQQQQPYTRPRHGSMGYSSSPTENGPWQHRMPRQSRSSVNLCQQAGFRKSTPPPGFAPNDAFAMPQSDAAMAAAVAAAANGYGGGSYYPYHHPLGIPTPPPSSSSPVHQKQGTASPYHSSHVMYL